MTSPRPIAVTPVGQPRVAAARAVLVTATAGYYHRSIPTARRVLQEVARRSGELAIETVLEDVPALSRLTATMLAAHDVLCFVHTSGELPLAEGQKRVILDFVAGGKGFVGVHSATATLYAWPAYGEMLGAYFREHPWVGPGAVVVEDRGHPSTRDLAPSFGVTDEFYTFRSSPRDVARILLRADAGSLGTEGDLPLAWAKPYGSGRVYYNALGHFDEGWEDPGFQSQLRGGLRWAARLEP
jgi:type 1 glutamine amidotransferase